MPCRTPQQIRCRSARTDSSASWASFSLLCTVSMFSWEPGDRWPPLPPPPPTGDRGRGCEDLPPQPRTLRAGGGGGGMSSACGEWGERASVSCEPEDSNRSRLLVPPPDPPPNTLPERERVLAAYGGSVALRDGERGGGGRGEEVNPEDPPPAPPPPPMAPPTECALRWWLLFLGGRTTLEPGAWGQCCARCRCGVCAAVPPPPSSSSVSRLYSPLSHRWMVGTYAHQSFTSMQPSDQTLLFIEWKTRILK